MQEKISSFMHFKLAKDLSHKMNKKTKCNKRNDVELCTKHILSFYISLVLRCSQGQHNNEDLPRMSPSPSSHPLPTSVPTSPLLSLKAACWGASCRPRPQATRSPRLWQNLLTTYIICNHQVAEAKMVQLCIAPWQRQLSSHQFIRWNRPSHPWRHF